MTCPDDDTRRSDAAEAADASPAPAGSAPAGGAIYDPENIFAKILRGEIPVKRVYEDDWVLAFFDHAPAAPSHVLVIPKNPYVSFEDFSLHASDQELVAFFRAVGHIARQAGLTESGYRLITNHGRDANQEVPHFHVHLLGGRALGPLVAPARSKPL